MGWSDGKGLGATESGATSHVKISFKDDTLGMWYLKWLWGSVCDDDDACNDTHIFNQVFLLELFPTSITGNGEAGFLGNCFVLSLCCNDGGDDDIVLWVILLFNLESFVCAISNILLRHKKTDYQWICVLEGFLYLYILLKILE